MIRKAIFVLLCTGAIGAGALWAYSHYRSFAILPPDLVRLESAPVWAVSCYRGQLFGRRYRLVGPLHDIASAYCHLGVIEFQRSYPSHYSVVFGSSISSESAKALQRAGQKGQFLVACTSMILPLWLPCVLFLACPAIVFTRRLVRWFCQRSVQGVATRTFIVVPCIVSAAVALTFLFLWLASYQRMFFLEDLQFNQTSIRFSAEKGVAILYFGSVPRTSGGLLMRIALSDWPEAVDKLLTNFGWTATRAYSTLILRVPLFSVFALSLVPVLFMLGTLLCVSALCRYRWRRSGLCLECGYDLTGNMSGRCPECGETVRSDWQRNRRLPRIRGSDIIRKAIIALLLGATIAIACIGIAVYCGNPFLLRMDAIQLYICTPDGYLVICEDVREPMDWRESDLRWRSDEEIVRKLAEVVNYRHIHMAMSKAALGCYHGRSVQYGRDVYTLIPLSLLIVPPALLLLAFGAPLSWRAYHRWRRRRKGLCLKCGYDLTGNISGVCPECGETV